MVSVSMKLTLSPFEGSLLKEASKQISVVQVFLNSATRSMNSWGFKLCQK